MKNLHKIIIMGVATLTLLTSVSVIAMAGIAKRMDNDTITIDGVIDNNLAGDVTLTTEGGIDIIDGNVVKEGLQKENGKYVYYNSNGEKLCDELTTIDGRKYYFDEDGNAVTNELVELDGYIYYFGKTGKAYKDIVKTVDGNRYYFNSKCHAVKSKFITVKGKTMYFDKNYHAITGKKSIKNYMCYFNDKGILQRKIDKNQKMVCVTYDDGPSIYTPKILDILEKYNAKATFFVVGNRIDTYKKHTKRAAKMGCEIGNHTWTHGTLYKSSTAPSEVTSELGKCNDKIYEVTGKKCVLYRPCGGGVTDTIRNNCGLPMILWSIDTLDWKSKNSQSVQNEVYGHVKDGDIILMHDLYSSTAAASEYIIPYLVDQGFQLVTVSEMADCKGVNLKNGTVYNNMRK